MKLTLGVLGLDEATKALAERFSERRLNAAGATALTRTALDIRQAVQREMRQVFDRPTRFTLNSVYVNPARGSQQGGGELFGEGLKRRGSTAKFMEAEVELKDDFGYTEPYVRPQVVGGPRRLKRLEKALQAVGALPAGWMVVPGAGARLDAYGNVSRGQVIQVLSQLRITLTAGYERNLSFDARKQINAQRKAGGRYFVAKPGARNLQPGVYIRELIGRNITPVFIFVQGVAYRPRLDFYGIAKREGQARLPVHLRRAIEEQAARVAGAGR